MNCQYAHGKRQRNNSNQHKMKKMTAIIYGRKARLLKQQSSFIIYRLPTKENKLFRLQQTNRTFRIPFFVCACMCARVRACASMYIFKFIFVFICCRLKRKPRRFTLFRLPFAHHASGRWSFVRLLTKKQTEVSYPLANGLNRLAHV